MLDVQAVYKGSSMETNQIAPRSRSEKSTTQVKSFLSHFQNAANSTNRLNVKENVNEAKETKPTNPQEQVPVQDANETWENTNSPNPKPDKTDKNNGKEPNSDNKVEAEDKQKSETTEATVQDAMTDMSSEAATQIEQQLALTNQAPIQMSASTPGISEEESQTNNTNAQDHGQTVSAVIPAIQQVGESTEPKMIEAEPEAKLMPITLTQVSAINNSIAEQDQLQQSQPISNQKQSNENNKDTAPDSLKTNLSAAGNESNPSPQLTAVSDDANAAAIVAQVETAGKLKAQQSTNEAISDGENTDSEAVVTADAEIIPENVAPEQKQVTGKTKKSIPETKTDSNPVKQFVDEEDQQPVTGNNEVKKIMEYESQRLGVKKPSAQSLVPEESTDIKNSVSQDSSVTISKILDQPIRLEANLKDVKTELPAQAAVNSQEVIDQIVKKVELVTKQANSEMQVQLKPEFLGKMMIKIAITDGVVTARFTTENQHVKQLLEANMNTLRHTLEASGLKVEKTEVNVSLENNSNFSNSDENRQSMWQEYASRQAYLSNGRGNNSYPGLESDYVSVAGEDISMTDNEIAAYKGISQGRVDFTI